MFGDVTSDTSSLSSFLPKREEGANLIKFWYVFSCLHPDSLKETHLSSCRPVQPSVFGKPMGMK